MGAFIKGDFAIIDIYIKQSSSLFGDGQVLLQILHNFSG